MWIIVLIVVLGSIVSEVNTLCLVLQISLNSSNNQPRPWSFPDLTQVPPVPNPNHKNLNHAVVATSLLSIAITDTEGIHCQCEHDVDEVCNVGGIPRGSEGWWGRFCFGICPWINNVLMRSMQFWVVFQSWVFSALFPNDSQSYSVPYSTDVINM